MVSSYEIEIEAQNCNPSDTGVMIQELTSVDGCDSVVTTTTSLLLSYEIEIEEITCSLLDTGIVIHELTSVEGCDSIIYVTRVNESVLANFSYSVVDSTVSFSDSSTNGNAYYWDFGNHTNSEEINPTHFYDSTGSYEVLFIASNEYCSDSIIKVVEINVVTGSALNAYSQQIELYPNPSRGNFDVVIEGGENQGTLLFVLYNVVGEEVERRTVSQRNFMHEPYQLDHLPSGSYFLQISGENVVIVLKAEVVR